MKRIDDVRKYAETIRKGGPALRAQKTGCILARIGTEGEEISTFVSSGILETVNRVRRDENGNPGIVATMADASGQKVIDRYGHANTIVISRETFDRKYRDAAKVSKDEQLFLPADGVQEFVQIREDITFTAPWGTDQHLKAGSFLNVTNPEDVYGIAYEEFLQTYSLLSGEECRKPDFPDE